MPIQLSLSICFYFCLTTSTPVWRDNYGSQYVKSAVKEKHWGRWTTGSHQVCFGCCIKPVCQIFAVIFREWSLTTYFLQGSAATDLRGGGKFNTSFFGSSFMNSAVKAFLLMDYNARAIVKISGTILFIDPQCTFHRCNHSLCMPPIKQPYTN